MVPGTPLAAWSGPDGSSLVVYRTLWVPAGSAEMLAEALGNRLENLPELKLLVKRTETVAGIRPRGSRWSPREPAMPWPPAGSASRSQPAGKTLIPTRQVTLAFAGPRDTIYLTWHMPEAPTTGSSRISAPRSQSLRFDSSRRPSRRK